MRPEYSLDKPDMSLLPCHKKSMIKNALRWLKNQPASVRLLLLATFGLFIGALFALLVRFITYLIRIRQYSHVDGDEGLEEARKARYDLEHGYTVVELR